MDTRDPDEYLPVEAAGNTAGISPRTLRYWVRSGKLPAVEGQRGKLVRLGDVLRLAELTGKPATLPAIRRQANGTAGNSATSAVGNAGNVANSPGDDEDVHEVVPPSGAVSPAARSQLEAIRDEWLRPLVDRIGELEREAGQLQERVAGVERERDAVTRERDDVAARLADDRKLANQLVNMLQAERDALAAEVERLKTAQDAPVAAREPQHGAQPVETAPDPSPSWWSTWWRRLIGGGR